MYYRNEHRRSRLPDEELDRELHRISEEENRAHLLLDTAQRELGLPELIAPETETLPAIAAHVLGILRPSPEAHSTDDDRRRLKSLLRLAVNRIVYRAEYDLDIELQFPPPRL